MHLVTPTITDLSDWREKIDYWFSIKVGGLTCRLLQIYGYSILTPILLNLFFNIFVFLNDLQDQKANIFEMVPLFLLFYPQYKTIKYLCQYIFVHRNEEILNEEKEKNNREVGSLEPFLESSLQVRSPFL